MPCNKDYRTRSTVRDSPELRAYFEFVNDTFVGGKWISSEISNWTNVLAGPVYEKSIVDTYCKASAVDDTGASVNPCKGLPPAECKKLCADCVAASKRSFNMVRSVVNWYTPFGGQQVNSTVYSINRLRRYREYGEKIVDRRGNPMGNALSRLQIPPLPPTQLELSNALRAITPSVEKFFPTVQLYEVLFELKELKKLLDLFKVNARTAASTEFSSNYLGYHFGYLPLMRTIEDVITILLTLDNVIDKWNDFATSDRIMDFHGTLREGEDKDHWTELSSDNSEWLKHYEYTYNASYTDVLKVHLYIKPHIIPGDMRFRVLLKALGIDKPLGGLWELIPFSWMVDYFTNVGDMIGRWETGLNSMFKFDVHSLGYSMRREVYAESHVSRIFIDGQAMEGGGPNKSYSSHFERVPLPITALRAAIVPREWGWEDGPTGKQLTYMVAVANNLRS